MHYTMHPSMLKLACTQHQTSMINTMEKHQSFRLTFMDTFFS